MYICLCKSLTDTDIHRGVARGEVTCMQSLRDRLGAATGCGCCEAAARDCLNEALADDDAACRPSRATGISRDEPAHALPSGGKLPDATPA